MVKKIVTRIDFAALAGVSAPAVTRACTKVLRPAVVGRRIDAAHPAALQYIETQIQKTHPVASAEIDPLYEKAIETCIEHGRWTASTLQRQMKIGYIRASRLIQMIELNGVKPAPGKPAPVRVRASTPPPPKAKQRQKPPAPPPPEPELTPPEDDGIFEVPEDIQSFADMTLRDLIARFGTDTRFVDWLGATQKIEMINEKRLKNAEAEGKLISRDLVKRAVIDQIDAVFVQMLTDGAKTMSGRAHAIAKAGGGADEVKKMIEDQLTSLIRPAKSRMRRALRDA